MSDIDDLMAVAARKYIERNSKKIVDNIFTMSPFYAWAKSVAEGTLGYDPDEDEFMDWVAKERGVEREHPPESIAGGQHTIVWYTPTITSENFTITLENFDPWVRNPKETPVFSISPQAAEDEEL